MKFGHLRSLQTHVRRHPPPVSRLAGAYRLTGHITCTSAGLVQAMLGWLAGDDVRRAAWPAIITAPFSLFGINSSVHSAPAPRARTGPALLPCARRYLLSGLVLAALAPGVVAQA